jgi:SPP1 gp7 family putative phage head morphogenesis protein
MGVVLFSKAISVNALSKLGISYVPVTDEVATALSKEMLITTMTNALDEDLEYSFYDEDSIETFELFILSLLASQLLFSTNFVRATPLSELALIERASYFETISQELLNSRYPTIEAYTRQFFDLGKANGYKTMDVEPFVSQADRQALFSLSKNNFNQIKGLSDDLTKQIRKTVWEGVANDHSVVQITNNLKKLPIEPLDVGNRTFTPEFRAQLIARTETMRARNQGLMNSYAEYGVDWFNQITKGDDRVSDICEKKEQGNPYPLKDFEVPPIHPQCRCWPEPALKPEKEPKEPRQYLDMVTGEVTPVNFTLEVL